MGQLDEHPPGLLGSTQTDRRSLPKTGHAPRRAASRLREEGASEGRKTKGSTGDERLDRTKPSGIGASVSANWQAG